MNAETAYCYTAAAAAAAGVQALASLSANAYWTLSPEGPIANLTRPLALPVPTNSHVLHIRTVGTSRLWIVAPHSFTTDSLWCHKPKKIDPRVEWIRYRRRIRRPWHCDGRRFMKEAEWGHVLQEFVFPAEKKYERILMKFYERVKSE